MRLDSTVFDVWVFRRTPNGVEFLLLYTSLEKAQRYFNGGRFWQIPSGFVKEDESITDAIHNDLAPYGLRATSIWAGEHAYIIYNRRFASMQLIGVYAAEVNATSVQLDPAEHAKYAWLPFDESLQRVHYRGLKEGLRSVNEYITGTPQPAPELCLFAEPPPNPAKSA